MRKLILTLLMMLPVALSAAPAIEGTWQGQLAIAPGNELLIQFIIESADSGYTVTLNSPDSGAIKNVKAGSASFENGELSVDVPELSGSFKGTLADGSIRGDWKQLDQSLPLVLVPAVTAELSDEFKARLVGRWQGSLTVPGATLTIEMNFEVAEDGQVTGNMRSPDQTPAKFSIRDVIVSETDIRLNVPQVNGSYTGKFEDEAIVGEWSQGQGFPLTLTKSAFDPREYALELSDEARALVMGAWFGHLSTPVGSIAVVYRFEQAGEDMIRGYMDSPDQGGAGIPIKTVTLADGGITIAMGIATFKGTVEAGKLVGELNQGQSNLPLTLDKGTLPSAVLDIPESLVGKWQGTLTTPNGDTDLIVRFEKDPEGAMVGFLDNPKQSMKGARIKEASLVDGALTFGSSILRISFTGTLDGDEIAGSLAAGPNNLDLRLTRSN